MTDKIKKKDPKLVILIALIAALAAVSAFLVWMNFQQKTEIYAYRQLLVAAFADTKENPRSIRIGEDRASG